RTWRSPVVGAGSYTPRWAPGVSRSPTCSPIPPTSRSSGGCSSPFGGSSARDPDLLARLDPARLYAGIEPPQLGDGGPVSTGDPVQGLARADPVRARLRLLPLWGGRDRR